MRRIVQHTQLNDAGQTIFDVQEELLAQSEKETGKMLSKINAYSDFHELFKDVRCVRLKVEPGCVRRFSWHSERGH